MKETVGQHFHYGHLNTKRRKKNTEAEQIILMKKKTNKKKKLKTDDMKMPVYPS